LDTSGHACIDFEGAIVQTGPVITDSAWHLVDMLYDSSGTTYSVTWYVDGVAQTQATLAGQSASDWLLIRVGSASTTTSTFWISDSVASVTSGDFPIGAHHVFPLYPNGDGTHVLGSTNAISDAAAGTSNLHQSVDDWTGSTPDTTTYVTYASTALGDAASNYAEFGFSNPADSTIWDVVLYSAGFAAGTSADSADTRVYTAHAGTLIDSTGLIDHSGSATVLGYYRKVLARPVGGWTASALNAAVVQWGYSGDTNSIPRLSALMMEYAAPDSVGGESEFIGMVPV
jgi:hypothetical protein